MDSKAIAALNKIANTLSDDHRIKGVSGYDDYVHMIERLRNEILQLESQLKYKIVEASNLRNELDAQPTQIQPSSSKDVSGLEPLILHAAATLEAISYSERFIDQSKSGYAGNLAKLLRLAVSKGSQEGMPIESFLKSGS